MTKELRDEIKNQTIGYIMAALGFVAGLAWNEAIKGLIDYFFPLGKNSLWVKFLYAILVTVVIVLIATVLLRKKDDDKQGD